MSLNSSSCWLYLQANESKILTLYQIFGRITDDWFLDAARLKQAANLILQAITTSENHPYVADLLRGEGEPLKDKNDWLTPVYMFLAGASIESLLKAIIIGRNMEYVEREQIQRKLASHNLSHLLTLAKFPPSTDQHDLVARLTKFILWAGRYPVPKNTKDSADDFSTKLELHNSSDPGAIDQLFASLQAIYVAEQTAREEKWNAPSESGTRAGIDEWLRVHAASMRAIESFGATQRGLERLFAPQQRLLDFVNSVTFSRSALDRMVEVLGTAPISRGQAEEDRQESGASNDGGLSDVDDRGPAEGASHTS